MKTKKDVEKCKGSAEFACNGFKDSKYSAKITLCENANN